MSTAVLGDILCITGLFLNVLVQLCPCYSKRKATNDIKLFVANPSPATLSLVPMSTILIIYWLPKGNLLCNQLPSLVIFIYTFAISKFTVLVCVRYVQITGIFYLRRSLTMLILFAVFVVATMLSTPMFYFHDKRWSIFTFEGCMVNIVHNTKEELVDKSNIRVVRYSFWLLVLQFIIPFFIIDSRLVLMFVHRCRQEQSIADDTPPRPNNQFAIRFTINAIFTISCVFVIVFLSFRLDDMESDEALSFLNKVFHTYILLFVIVFCFPWYLMEMIYSQCAVKEEEKCLVPAESEIKIDV